MIEKSGGHVSECGEPSHEIAKAVRDACAAAAVEAYESAKMSGLCEEGAWEVAVGAIRALDVESIINDVGE